MSSCKNVLTALREAIDAKLPEDQRCKKTIAQMTEAVQSIEVGGGSMDFYKCYSVDTSTKKWTGYKAILSDGKYSFGETLTEGLSYGDGFVPKVGNMYPDGALFVIGGVWVGEYLKDVYIVAPLKENARYTVGDGQAETVIGTVTYGMQQSGEACAFFDRAVVRFQLPAVPRFFTASVKLVPSSEELSSVLHIGHDGRSTLGGILFDVAAGVIMFDLGSGTSGSAAVTDIRDRHCYTLRRNDTMWSIFVDGIPVIEATHDPAISEDAKYVELGGVVSEYGDDGRYAVSGYYSDFQYYSRSLSDDEIASIFSN
jgi:hypothetical protein